MCQDSNKGVGVEGVLMGGSVEDVDMGDAVAMGDTLHMAGKACALACIG